MEFKVKNGIVKLRLPSFSESWRIRSLMGAAPEGVEPAAYSIMKLSEVLPAYIDISGVKKCKTPMDLINDPDNSKEVIIMLGHISERIMEFSGEKK